MVYCGFLAFVLLVLVWFSVIRLPGGFWVCWLGVMSCFWVVLLLPDVLGYWFGLVFWFRLEGVLLVCLGV